MRSVPSFVLAVLVVACSAPSKPAPVSDQARSPDQGHASDELTTPKPIALGLVISGQEVWAGNDEIEADPAAQYHGALGGLRAAITEDPPAGKLPAGSQAVVVTYATGAVVRLPLGPIDRLTADALGKQADYHRKLGDDLVQGVELGLAELAKAETPRRVLVVIGDGNDTDIEHGRPALASLRETASAEIYAIVYRSAVSDEGSIINALTPNVTVVTSSEGFRAALADIWRRVAASDVRGAN